MAKNQMSFIAWTPSVETIEDEFDENTDANIEELNDVLDLYRNDEMEYEAKCFASSCVYDASDELPF